jgi:hypothetical protein
MGLIILIIVILLFWLQIARAIGNDSDHYPDSLAAGKDLGTGGRSALRLDFHQNRVADFPSAIRVFALTHSRRKVCALQTAKRLATRTVSIRQALRFTSLVTSDHASSTS